MTLLSERLIKKNFWLFLILAIGLTVRVYGIWFYLPLHMHLDENNLFGQAFNILKTKDWNTHYFRYPAFFPYLQAIFYNIYLFFYKILFHHKANIPLEMHINSFFVIGRGISVIAGTCTMYITYLIGLKLFNRTIALFSTLYLALTFVHVVFSHYLITDALMIFFGTLAFYYSIGISIELEKNIYWKFFFVGMLIGFANGIKYNPFYLLFLMEPLFMLWGNQNINKKNLLLRFSKGMGWGIVGMIIAFIMVNPFMLIEASEAVRGFISQVVLFKGNEVTIMSDSNDLPTWKWWVEYLMKSGLTYPLFILSISGLLFYIFDVSKKYYYPLLFFPMVFCIFIFTASHRADRYIGPVLPFFAIFGGVSLERFYNFNKNIRLKKSPNIFLLLTMLLFFTWPLMKIIAFDYLISKKDTRLLTGNWVLENLPKDKMIFAIAGATPVGQYLQSKGYTNTINIHKYEFETAILPFENSTIFNYSNSLVIVNRVDFIEAKNYISIKPFPSFINDYNKLKSNSFLVKEFSLPLFRNDFFSPSHLLHSATIHSYHNPTIQIFRIPNSPPSEKKKIIYPAKDLAKYSNFNLINNQRSKVLLYASENKEASIAGPHQPFPSGWYVVKYKIKIKTNPSNEKIISFIVQSSGGGIVYNKSSFFLNNFKNQSEYQEINLPFHLERSSRLEFLLQKKKKGAIWVDNITVQLINHKTYKNYLKFSHKNNLKPLAQKM